jgi:hypothetical protein
VSCAALVRLRNSEGKFALLLNDNRAAKGEMVFSPIGGGIEATREGRQELQEQFNLADEAFEAGQDLRLHIQGKDANRVRLWFLKRVHRETNPLRELTEELIEESHLLDPMNRLALERAPCTFVGYTASLAPSTRVGQEGKLTLFFFEIFDVTLNPALIARLEEQSHHPKHLISFVTPDEIQAHRSQNGETIAQPVQELLRPQPTIPAFQ